MPCGSLLESENSSPAMPEGEPARGINARKNAKVRNKVHESENARLPVGEVPLIGAHLPRRDGTTEAADRPVGE